MRTGVLGLAILLCAVAPAAARSNLHERGEAKLAQEVRGLVPGKPLNCITLSRIRESEIIDGTAIVYRVNRTVYVNRPLGAESMRNGDIPVQYSWGSQLCQLDRVRLLDRGTQIERGVASLNEFVPYTRPGKRAD